MISKLFILFTAISFVGFSQVSSDPCDSIFIHSCQPNATGNQVEVLVSNHSFDLMDYPGFILFNANGDTIAIENTDYFGIGWNEQIHILEIINQPALPFTGTLELHTFFYDSLRCVFSTSMGTSAGFSESKDLELNVYPNPSHDWIQLSNINHEKPLSIQIWNILGEKMNSHLSGDRISVSSFPEGVYLIKIRSLNSIKTEKFIVRRNL